MKLLTMPIKTFGPYEKLPPNIIFPQQTHSTNIIEIVTGNEDLFDCDGIFTRDNKFTLGIKTADCAPICFWDDKKFGIIHAGWRGLVNGICEKMLKKFDNPKIWIGPLLPIFEIKKDFCFEKIQQKFGDKFFIFKKSPANSLFLKEGEFIEFNFKEALQSVLPNAKFDDRSTFEDLSLASWRRDQNGLRDITIIKK